MKKQLLCGAAALLCTFFLSAPLEAAENPGISVSAASCVLINAETGTVLYEKNAHEQRAIASTTKIMTALVTIEAGELDKAFTVDPMAIRVEGTSMGLREGDIVTRRALLYGMLLPSGNDAANAAAVSVCGTMDSFARRMNAYAKAIGMTESNFVNPSGLDADGHYSTAYDMALLARKALQNDIFREICSQANAKVFFGNPPYERWLHNSNKLLWSYEGCVGVKTGFTDNARRCLVSAAQRNGVSLICVTLNAPNDWQDHTKLLDYGFKQVKTRQVELESIPTVSVIGGEKDCVAVVPSEPLTVAVSAEQQAKAEVRLEPFLYAGFDKGEQVGKVIITVDGAVIKEIPLITSEGVKQAPCSLNFFEGIFQFLRQFFR